MRHEQIIADITKMVWNKYIATPKNEHKDMQFSYQGLKHEIATIVIDALTPPLNEDFKKLAK